MIKNERQYLISKNQVQKFNLALQAIQKRVLNNELDPFVELEISAIKSQISEIQEEIFEYESLRNKCVKRDWLENIEEIPTNLIKARIAAGITQKALAEKMGLKEQQIQRYESTDYQTASLSRIIDIAKAIGLDFHKKISGDKKIYSIKNLFKSLSSIGLDAEFVINRFFPKNIDPKNIMGQENEGSFVLNIAGIIGKVFDWDPFLILENCKLDFIPKFGEVNFKTAKRVSAKKINAYLIYAQYVSLLVFEGLKHLQYKKIPNNSVDFRAAVLKKFNSIDFSSVLEFAWDNGIPVIPLSDSGGFHGACFRVGGKNAIILKQNTLSVGRWLFDLLHELWHVGQQNSSEDLNLLTIDSADIESEANSFAGDVILNGRSEELVQTCVKEANGQMRFLKAALTRVAQRENVDKGVLANYMAYRLSLQGENWWGTANNLQQGDFDPSEILRNALLKRLSLKSLNPIDQEILLKAIS